MAWVFYGRFSGIAWLAFSVFNIFGKRSWGRESMKNILIIDASYLTRMVYRCFFVGQEYSVREAFSYSEVVSIIEKNNIDLIILDVDFLDAHDVSGEQVYRYIREEKHVTSPMIILFGEWLRGGDLQSKSQENDRWMCKPVDLVQMRREVEKMLGHSLRSEKDGSGIDQEKDKKDKGEQGKRQTHKEGLCWII